MTRLPSGLLSCSDPGLASCDSRRRCRRRPQLPLTPAAPSCSGRSYVLYGAAAPGLGVVVYLRLKVGRFSCAGCFAIRDCITQTSMGLGRSSTSGSR